MLGVTVILIALVASGNTSPAVPVYDTIIVGMGASGSAAASVLCKAGKKVLGLEAMNRVGGRIKTVPLGDGLAEVGAEWLHGSSPNPVHDLAIQHNVTILSQKLDNEIFRSDGSNTDQDLIKDLVEFAESVSFEHTEVPEPVGQHVVKRVTEYIKTKYPDLVNNKEFLQYFYHYMDLVTSGLDGAYNWNQLVTFSNYQLLEGDQHLSFNKYGYKTLFEFLLNTYQGGPGYPTLDLKLEKVVTKISYPQDPAQNVEVTCSDGSIYKAKNVIVTVSLGVLKESYESLFTPALPDSKIAAIKGISMGLIGKIIFLFPNQWYDTTNSDSAGFFWNIEDKKGLEDDWTYGIAGATVPLGNRHAMTLWSSGETTKKIETLPEQEVKTKAMALIRRFMGKDKQIPEPITMLRTDWFSNPYTRGTYTFENLQTPDHPHFRADLAEPLVDSSGTPRVLFAGEASNPIHFSTVHGAVETGFREGHRLVPQAA